jgi:hypothetical protein
MCQPLRSSEAERFAAFSTELPGGGRKTAEEEVDAQ